MWIDPWNILTFFNFLWLWNSILSSLVLDRRVFLFINEFIFNLVSHIWISLDACLWIFNLFRYNVFALALLSLNYGSWLNHIIKVVLLLWLDRLSMFPPVVINKVRRVRRILARSCLHLCRWLPKHGASLIHQLLLVDVWALVSRNHYLLSDWHFSLVDREDWQIGLDWLRLLSDWLL